MNEGPVGLHQPWWAFIRVLMSCQVFVVQYFIWFSPHQALDQFQAKMERTKQQIKEEQNRLKLDWHLKKRINFKI